MNVSLRSLLTRSFLMSPRQRWMSVRLVCFRMLVGAAAMLAVSLTWADDSLRVLPEGELPDDSRLGELKDLNGYFPFEVPETVEQWEQRREELQRRVQVATGLWPMPPRTPLNPVIHGRVERDGFTVERVYFESLPNHYVTGLLFRPLDGKKKRPGVLCPHGHGGRMQDYGTARMPKLIEQGAEKFEDSGRYPKLARCAQLARMGCVTFIFDMLGYADSVQISYELAHRFGKQRPEFEDPQRWGLYSTQAELRLQNIMGLQTWNSVRALDFLCSLPDVDASRIGVTGGSGGGTQTILLCAIDLRPIVAFPQGMVSTSMQGGCTCENCSLLRIGTGNVELAALFAPKPQAMTAANDWTKQMMTKGFPELRQLYSLLGAEDNVMCWSLVQFPHNYNYVTRGLMYNWFNEHLQLGLDEPIVEQDWKPLSKEEWTVWNDDHPRPETSDDYERELLQQLDQQSREQLRQLTPSDAKSLERYRAVVGGAFRTLIGRDLPDADAIKRIEGHKDKDPAKGYMYFEDLVRLELRGDGNGGEELPLISLYPAQADWNGEVVIWIDGRGKAGMFDGRKPIPPIRRLLDAGTAVVGADLLYQGEFLEQPPLEQNPVVKNPREFAGYTYGYNSPVFAQRVHDILTLIRFVQHDEHGARKVHLVGVEEAAPLALAARAIAGSAVDRAAVTTSGFRFTDLASYRDPMFLPGAVKYGDLPALMALSAPHPLWIAGESELPELVQQTYQAANAANAVKLARDDSLDQAAAAVAWLLGK